VGSIVASYVFLSSSFAAIGLSYFTLNVAYSFALKHVPFVDVACIAAGFLLRLVGGAVAVSVPITIWIFATTFLLALFLALGKRKHEILSAGEKKKEQRKVLARYDLGHISIVMTTLAVATALTYAAYTIWGDQTGRLFHPRDLAWTIPCVVFGLLRFDALTRRAETGHSPTDLMLRDPPFLANLAVWSIAVVVIIYLR
jgi:decaprenyl-phosphate phosphoribosyltransferase